MATSVKKLTSKLSDIQSRAQEAIQTGQKQAVSSTQATQSWSTTTPKVTDTPKVTSTAKAMPSITRPDISSIVPTTTTPTTTTTVNAKDLLWSKTTPTLRKAATPDLLSKTEEKKEVKDTTIPLNIVSTALNLWWKVAQTVTDSLYEQWLDWINDKFTKLEKTREMVTDVVWKTAIDFFKWVGSDISTQFEEWKWLWMTYNAVMNTLQWIPRWIARIEYWASELLDWVADTDWSESIKQSFKSDLEYWENTKTYQKIKETEWFSDFLKNPLMYAWGTLWEMLPMFINAWVAIPTIFAQIYWETYSDYSQDASLQEAWLSDNQVRLMSLWVAWVNTIIELWSDLIQWLMPWTKTAAKWAEKEIRRSLSKPFYNFFRKISKWWVSEWLEEVLQNEMQSQVAIAWGSDRPAPTWQERLTIWWISSIIWAMFWWWDFMINFSQNNELNAAFNEWSEAVDKIAPWVSQKDKKTLFSAIVSAQVEDMQMSEDKVNKYEAETTELYNAIEELTNQLETTTDEKQKEQIQNQIDLANKRINTIDEMINKAKKVEEEVAAKLQLLSEQRQQEQEIATEEELPAVKQEIQMPSEIGGENLSEQTMKTSEDKSVVDSTPIEDMDNNKILDARKFRLVNKPQTPQERKRQKDIENEIEIRMNNYKLPDSTKESLEDLTFDIDNMSIWEAKAVIKELDRLKKNAREEKRYDDWNEYTHLKRKVQDKLKDLLRMDEERDEAKTEQRDKESILPETPVDDKDFFDKWSNKININKYALKVFLLDRKHIPWLKWIKISWVEDLSESEIMEVAKNAATVAWILWIDFNKILDLANVEFSVLNLKWEDVKWAEDVSGKLYLEASKYYDILKMAIILKDTWPSVFWHELMHLLDKEYLYRNDKLWTGKKNDITKASMLRDASFKTYNVPYIWYKFDDKDYWDTSREILARFAEQYIAKQVDEREYQALTWRDFYWSDKEFNKLVPKFEKIISRFSEFMLDKWDKVNYPEIMRKIAEIQYKQTQFSLGTETEMVNSLMSMKEDYDEIVKEIEKIKDETLKLELESAASTLYSNYEMLNKMKEEYLQKQKTTPGQQDTIDNITETEVPNPPQNPQTIIYWLPYFWWSNIEEWIGDIIEWWKWEKLWDSYAKEEDIIKIRKKSKKIKWFFKELWQAWQDVFTPAISRIYNISPRVAWRLVTMETQKDINIYRYRQKAKWFVETLGKLKGNNALEVKMALLDYWALASEQWADITEYKKQEVAKLREVLLRNGFKEKDINDMFEVLNDIWKQYQDAWLKLTTTDMYFPRVVKDYEWLIDYMNRVSGKDIKVNKLSLMLKIKNIQADPDLTAEEKEAKIRRAISTEFSQPWTTSQHAKERKMWKLSDWWEWIFAYYESPIEALDHYIVTMTNAIQRQLFLWWMKEDADITEADILNQNTAESVSTIIWKLVEQWKVNEDDVEELQKSILAVLNKKPSPKSVTALKDVTYIATITNFLSAINQLDDLWMVILKDRSWLKHIVKTIFGKAWIKYDDLWLEDAYEMFREEWWITNWLFKKSLFNMFDRLGKTSFINTAWESMIRQSKNEKTRNYLYARLQAMYWTESADRMMEKIDSVNYMTDWQIDIEILRDLLYQLWSTQPIYTSAMPTTYLNHPRARLCYALSSFTLKRIDWLVQWTKEVNAQHWAVAAAAWLMWVSTFLAMFWAAIWDVWDLLKWKKEETFLWNLINKWIDDALAAWWSNALDSWLKIWDLSEYDIKTYKSQWLWWVISSKLKPFVFDLGKDVVEAVWEHDLDEITDIAKYVPIFWKLTYYWFWDELWKSTKKSKEKKDEWDFWEDDFNWWEEDWDWWEDFSEEDEWNWDEEDWGF